VVAPRSASSSRWDFSGSYLPAMKIKYHLWQTVALKGVDGRVRKGIRKGDAQCLFASEDRGRLQRDLLRSNALRPRSDRYARRHLTSAQPSEGFTQLWQRGRLGLTVEATVPRPEFADLFTEEERDACRRRLKEYGYNAS
jgi:hypothetical protein